MPSLIARDSNATPVQLMGPAGTPQTLTVNASGGAATLSAAIEAEFVRLHPTVDTFFFCTVAGSVTAGTGHFLAAGGCYDIPLVLGTTKISVLGVGGAGICYLSELGAAN